MSRGKGMLFALVAIGSIMASPVLAATTPGAVAATDERAPEAVTNVIGFPGTAGVEISWALSASDFVRQSPTGSDFTSGGSFSNVNDVAGYNVYRGDELAGSTLAGETIFVDVGAVGSTIIYVVTAFDAAGNESDASDEVIVSLGAPPVAVIEVDDDYLDGDGDYGIIDPDGQGLSAVDIWNEGTAEDALLIVTVNIVGEGFSSPDSTLTIAPEDSDFVEIFFDAEDVDNVNAVYEGVVTIRTNDPENREFVYDVVAEIVDGVGLPEIGIKPGDMSNAPGRQLDLASTLVGASRTRTVTISNIGGLTLEGTVEIYGDDAFSISADSYSLGTEEEQVVDVTFTPGAVDTYSATLTIFSNDDQATSTEIDVTGRGLARYENPSVIETPVTKVEMVFDRELPTEQVDLDALRDQIIAALSEAMGIPISRFVDVVLTEGSVIVNFTITQTVTEEGEPTAAEAVATLESVIADTVTPNVITDIAPVASVVDNSETVVLQPEDANGFPVLGWFTRNPEGRVGLDDFFHFVEKFGSVTGDAHFSAEHDLTGRSSSDPDGLVGIDDFFIFVSHFGKIIVNADQILAALE